MTLFDRDAIGKSPIFSGLTNEELDQVVTALSPTLVSYHKKEMVIGQGDFVKHIGIVLEGRITGVKYHYDGSSQILRIFKTMATMGLESVSSSFRTCPYAMISETYSTVAYFKYSDLLESTQIASSIRDPIIQNIINILADENIRMMYKIDTLSKRTLRERIMTHLFILKEKRSSNTVDIAMTQDQFAQYLCVNRSVLSKEINAMRREGIIDYKKSIYTIK